MSEVTTTTRRGVRPSRRFTNWTNIFVIILVIVAVGVLWTSTMWTQTVRALVYTAMIMLIPFVIIRLAQVRMSRMMDIGFVIIGLGVGWLMTDPTRQDWFRDTVRLQITPLGLADPTGQILLENSGFILVLLGALVFGLFLYREQTGEIY